jgi:tryptophanyl-tRNA synthetase
MYKAQYVPVGEDQVAHVELTREIARRFNLAYGELVLPPLPPAFLPGLATASGIASRVGLRLWADISLAEKVAAIQQAFRSASLDLKAYYVNNGLGTIRPIFPEPQALLTPTPKLPGTDGRKMSKSYDNAIFLADAPDVVSGKLATMITDPARKRRTDPGNPDVCPVFDLHKVFSSSETIDRVNRECRTAEIGCVDCKKLLAQHLNESLAPIQERRKPYEQNPQRVWDILEAGTAKARQVAQATMAEVRAAVKLT